MLEAVGLFFHYEFPRPRARTRTRTPVKGKRIREREKETNSYGGESGRGSGSGKDRGLVGRERGVGCGLVVGREVRRSGRCGDGVELFYSALGGHVNEKEVSVELELWGYLLSIYSSIMIYCQTMYSINKCSDVDCE
jgi:hypothetical protein